MHGFTCGVDDLILLPQYDVLRKEELEGEDVGEEVHCDFVNFKRGKIGMVLYKNTFLLICISDIVYHIGDIKTMQLDF